MIVWMESCQRLPSSALMQQRYYMSGLAVMWYPTGGRNGGPCFGPATAQVDPWYPVPSGPLFLSGVRVSTIFVTQVICPTYNDLPQVGLFGNMGTLYIKSGGLYGTTLATAAGVYDGNIRYIAFECLIDPTVGYTRVYLDGVLVDALSLDNINTQPVGGGYWNGFSLGGNGTYPKMCDLLVADGTDPSGSGDDLHTIWMDARIDYIPVNGQGYSSQFVGSDEDSVDNYRQVSEVPPDEDVTFVYSDVPAIDAYTKAPYAVPLSTILGTAVYARGRKTDAGVEIAKVGLRSGSTNLMSPQQPLPVNYADVYLHVGHDPAGGPFTVAGIDGMQVVIEKV